MKYDCELIEDILPLYVDDVLREKSRTIVDEHLAECEACRTLYQNSRQSADLPPAPPPENRAKVKSYSKRIKKMRIFVVSTILVILLSLFSSFVSYVNFNTPNFLASGFGVLRILFTDTETLEIRKSPRIVLASPENSWQLFLDTIEAEGYTYLEEERMGGLCVIEKDGQKERVFFSVNGYFSKWIWEG